MKHQRLAVSAWLVLSPAGIASAVNRCELTRDVVRLVVGVDGNAKSTQHIVSKREETASSAQLEIMGMFGRAAASRTGRELLVDLSIIPSEFHDGFDRLADALEGGLTGAPEFRAMSLTGRTPFQLEIAKLELMQSGAYLAWNAVESPTGTSHSALPVRETGGKLARETSSRQIFRHPDGTLSIAHTLSESGAVLRREVIARDVDLLGRAFLRFYAESILPTGQIEVDDTSTCRSCHEAYGGTESRLTKLQCRLSEDTGYLRPIPTGARRLPFGGSP